jgi:hypothetical protein
MLVRFRMLLYQNEKSNDPVSEVLADVQQHRSTVSCSKSFSSFVRAKIFVAAVAATSHPLQFPSQLQIHQASMHHSLLDIFF